MKATQNIDPVYIVGGIIVAGLLALNAPSQFGAMRSQPQHCIYLQSDQHYLCGQDFGWFVVGSNAAIPMQSSCV